MASDIYSKAILAGLRARGESDAEIRRITGLSADGLKAIRSGKKRLSPRILDRIEDQCGISAGQLAALSMEPDGGSLTELCDMLAAARSDIRKTAKTPANGKSGHSGQLGRVRAARHR